MEWITTFIVCCVLILTVIASVFLFLSVNDYQKWLFLGVGFSFSAMMIGGMIAKLGIPGGYTLSLMGNVMLMCITGLSVIVCAADKWMQKKGFYMKPWQKQQLEETPCKKPPTLSISQNLSRN